VSRNQCIVVAALAAAAVLVMAGLAYLLLDLSGFSILAVPTMQDGRAPTHAGEQLSKLEALRQIDLARQYVDDIFVPGDEFATGVFRTMIGTRLRQAREYVESDDYTNALERLYLAEHDARDPSALGGEAIAEHCQEAIRIVRALR
jgi:predicted lipoprotein